MTRNTIRETNISKARKRRRDNESHKVPFSNGPQTSCDSAGNGDLPPVGKKGAAAAPERLERQEEEMKTGMTPIATGKIPLPVVTEQVITGMVVTYREKAALLRAMKQFVQGRADGPFRKRLLKFKSGTSSVWWICSYRIEERFTIPIPALL